MNAIGKPWRLSAAALMLTTGFSAAIAREEVIEEIVVTAQKRSESAQDVPIALTAFNEAFFRDTSVSTLHELIDYTPGFTGTTTGGGNPAWGIRGAVSNDAFAGSENSVGVFQDEAYIGRDQLAGAAFFDVQRVEVLKGPQGSLFGRNTIAGAINIIANKPQNSDSLSLFLGAGNESQRQFEAIANWAANDHLAFRFGARYEDFDGIDLNVVNGKERFTEALIARASMAWAPTELLDVLLTLQMSDNENNYQRYHNPDLALAFGNLEGTVPFGPRIAQDGPNFEDIETEGVDVRLTWNFDESLTLTSITDYRKFTHDYAQDIDGILLDLGPVFGIGTGVGGVNFGFNPSATTYAQEFRLSGIKDRLDWFLGASYFKEDISEDNNLFTDGPVLALSDRSFTSGDTRALAVYGDAAYHLSEQWTIRGGMRYTRDQKSWCVRGVAGLVGSFGETAGRDLCTEDSWTDVSPRLVVDYSPTPELLIYASVALGYKAGGFGGTAIDEDGDGIGDRAISFDPEELKAIEFGLKATLLDNRLQANISAYSNDYKDLQVENIENANVVISNAADADINGLELEINWLPPVNGMTLYANYSLIDGEVSGEIEGIQVRKNRPGFTPKHSYTVAARQELETGSGQLAFYLAYNWKDKVYFDSFQTPLLTEDDYGLLNGSVRYTSGSGRWNLAIVGENLSDQEYSLLNQNPVGFGTRHFIRGLPRMVRLEFGINFQ